MSSLDGLSAMFEVYLDNMEDLGMDYLDSISYDGCGIELMDTVIIGMENLCILSHLLSYIYFLYLFSSIYFLHFSFFWGDGIGRFGIATNISTPHIW